MFCDFSFGRKDVSHVPISVSVSSVGACFEGEGGAGDGAATGEGASAGAAAGAGGTAGAAAGAAAAGGETRFTQDDLNRFLAEDRRKHQVQLQKMESQLNELAKSKSLTEQEHQTLKENLDTIAGQLRTKEQQLTLEKRQLEEQYQTKIRNPRRRHRPGKPCSGTPPSTARCKTPP